MITVFHELLPASYSITLALGDAAEGEAALAHQLRCAVRSGKAEVWVDCQQLPGLSEEAARLLWATHHRLQAQYARLVLVNVTEPVRRRLLRQELGPLPRIIAAVPVARPVPPGLRAERGGWQPTRMPASMSREVLEPAG